MTTTLMVVLDPPSAAMHDDDPVGWTAGYVRGVLMQAGLVVHEVGQHAEFVLGAPRPEFVPGVTRPPSDEPKPPEHVCPIPWCRKEFTQQHHVKMHMRSHQEQACQHCGRTYKLTGLLSHERSCNAAPAAPAPETQPRAPRRRGAQPEVPAPEPKAKARPAPPAMPDLGPIERRPFDPDRVRAAQADAQLVGPRG